MFHAFITSPPPAALMWCIFILTYIGIALGKIPGLTLDRVGIALVGAIALLCINAINVEQAALAISYETLLLLFGLMIFSGQLKLAGFYTLAGRFITRRLDQPRRLLAGLILISAILSALLANDIVCLAFTPLLCRALLEARKNPLPFLLALATSSNIGSAATLIGNPQNMHIGAVAQLSFAHFSWIMLPVVVIGLVINYLMILWMFKPAIDGWTDSIISIKPPLDDAVIERPLILKTLVLLAILIGVFLCAPERYRVVAALAGAGLLMCSTHPRSKALHQSVDWNLLLLFLGLFVINGAMRTQVNHAFAQLQSTGINLERPITLSTITLALSNLVSNVPAVLLLQNPIQSAPPELQQKLWYILALISTWAGNLTLVGSIANLIVAEAAAPFGITVDLKTYCKIGIPLTLITIVLGTTWVMWVM